MKTESRMLSQLLRERLEDLALELLGQRNQSHSTRDDWRWGSHGSFSLQVSGRKRGKWYDHEQGEGGDVFDLIKRFRKCSFSEALAWAREWVGLDGKAKSSTNSAYTHSIIHASSVVQVEGGRKQ